MCIFWNLPRETTCMKLCMLYLTSYVYFLEHARPTQIICEKFTCHCTISTWNVNCINLFSSALVEIIFGYNNINIMLSYQLFALREKNKARLELSSEVFNVIYTFSPRIRLFVTCKERHNLCMSRVSLDRECLIVCRE